MTKPVNTAAIEAATHITWGDWSTYLGQSNAKNLSHKAIASLAYQKMKDSIDNPGWWAQSVAVAYEQHIGRRKAGQRSDGTFEVSVSKTVSLTLDQALQAWIDLYDNRQQFSGVPLAKQSTTSATETRRHWGCTLADDSRVNIDVSEKTSEKVLFTISHIRLSSSKAADRWRIYWKNIIGEYPPHSQ